MKKLHGAAVLLLGIAGGVLAQTNPSAPRPFVEEQRQQERERAVRAQQEKTVDARLPQDTRSGPRRLPATESPCFRIDRLTLQGDPGDAFGWLLAEAGGESHDDPRGRCLGTQGIDIVLERLQQALVSRGWITSRVLAAPQDLNPGVLTLTLVPGRIAAIRLADTVQARTSLRTAIPARVGDLLNLRDIEQGLENLKRLPTADADIQIVPSSTAGARPGDSELVVTYESRLPLRATLSLDDSGTRATGRTQAGATLAWDGPLQLNDLAYVSLNHDAFNHRGQGTSGQTAHYSVPYGDWLLGATASAGTYHQTLAGLSQDYVHAGRSRNAEVRLARLLQRDQHGKTSVSLRGYRRASNSFIDDTEIEVQRRAVAGWDIGLNRRQFLEAAGQTATLDANLTYRRGTGAFGAQAAPEQEFGEGTSRLRLITADASLNLPFQAGGQRLRYTGLWRAQWNRTPLTPQDAFAIGGRYTVRGFDGENSLLADRGWLLRNDLGLALGQSGVEFYAGIDYGEVGGRTTAFLLGRRLAGGVAGVRGAWRGLNYDFFVGAPISKPDGYRTARVTAGFSLNHSF